MPKFTKCWYKNCNSDNREEPKLLFYKFPKDPDRCEQWINNCSNDELTKIWSVSPDKVAALRVCQRHFLKEFLGSSSRLVGHAVPAPYGVSLDKIDAERFMVDCASLKSSTSSSARHNHQQRSHTNNQQNHYNIQSQSHVFITQANNNDDVQCIVDSNQNKIDYNKSPIVKTNPTTLSHPTQTGLLMTVDQANYHQFIGDPHSHNNNNQVLTPTCQVHYQSTAHSRFEQHHGNEGVVAAVQTISCRPETTSSLPHPNYQHQNNNNNQQQHHLTNIAQNSSSPGLSRLGLSRNANPKINYDREGKVVSIQYPTETLSLIKTDDKEQHNAHIEALKHKVRHYQRKLAVLNHRYQKLRAQIKGRSNKMRLLESLKVCKSDFDPCIFEIFKRQIKGSTSKHGNRWSSDVKSFSSSIYLRSRSAYKFIRKTIDLPSESIVKRYIVEKRLSKLPNVEQDNGEENDDDLDSDDGDDEDDMIGGDNMSDGNLPNGHSNQRNIVTSSDI